MEKLLGVLNLTLFIAGYVILVVPVLIILLIADMIKERGSVKMFDTEMMQNFEG